MKNILFLILFIGLVSFGFQPFSIDQCTNPIKIDENTVECKIIITVRMTLDEIKAEKEQAEKQKAANEVLVTKQSVATQEKIDTLVGMEELLK